MPSDDPDKPLKPTTSADTISAPIPAPRSADGKRAWWFVLGAFISILAVNLLFEGSTATGRLVDIIRIVLVISFAACGAGALVSAIRAIRSGDQGVMVWVAGAIGLAIVLLMIGEFTVLE